MSDVHRMNVSATIEVSYEDSSNCDGEFVKFDAYGSEEMGRPSSRGWIAPFGLTVFRRLGPPMPNS